MKHQILASLGRGLGSWLGLPSRETLGLPTASLPTASLGGSPPEVQLVRPAQAVAVPAQAQASAAAPVAAATPRFRKSPVDHEGFTAYQRKMQHEARLKTEFGFHEKLSSAGMKAEARRAVLSDFDRYVAARPAPCTAAKAAPATDDDGVPVKTDADATIDSTLDLLQKGVEDLRKLLGEDSESADETEAKAARAAGKKGAAFKALGRAHEVLGARLTARRSLRNQPPDGHRRAHALIAGGFNDEPGVAALNASLHRKPAPLSLTQRSSLALAPVGRRTPPARPAAVAKSDSPPDVVKINSIRAQLKDLDQQQRREFSNARHAEYTKLSAQLKAEIRKFRVS